MEEIRYVHIRFKAKKERPPTALKKKKTKSYRMDTIEKKLLVPSNWEDMGEENQIKYAQEKVDKEANKMGFKVYKLSYVEGGSASKGVLVGDAIYTYEGEPIK